MIIHGNAFLKNIVLVAEGHPLHLQICDARIRNNTLEALAHQLTPLPEDIENTIEGSEHEPIYLSAAWRDGFSLITDPGREDKETLTEWLASAQSGGFRYNTILPDTHPVPDNGDMIRGFVTKPIFNAHPVQIIGALTRDNKGTQLAELRDMMQQGCKVFSHGFRPAISAQMMRNALEYLQGTDACILVIPFDGPLTAQGQMHEGSFSVQTGLKGIPTIAETAVIHRDCALALQTGTHVHFTGISSAESVRMIYDAKQKGAPVSASVFATHLFYTDQALLNFNTHLKLIPPLRSESDRYALIQGLLEGVIDGIVSGHSPSTPEEKKVEFPAASFGSATMAETFSLAWRALVHTNKMQPAQLIRFFTQGIPMITGSASQSLALQDTVSVWHDRIK
jgi:dihydroorotase